ncbi:MAG: response regulator [Opitutaceae bacterium]|nr:response regulator [Verrucomicrobiales bacterium]
MSTKILCVDDDPHILAAYQRNLRKQFTLEIALGPEEGLTAIDQRGPFAVIVADMQMPGMNGVQFLARAQEKSPDAVRIMLTGNADQKTAMDAVNEGHVFRFLTKPCPPEMFAQTLTAGLEQHRLINAEREVLEQTLNGTTKVQSDILAILDPVSFGLGQKLRDYMRAYTQHLKITQTWDLELAAMMGHIGFVTIPPTVLLKLRAGLSLKPEEKDMLTRVPRTGADLLANIPRLEGVASIVLYQNKNYDGTGFPLDASAGEKIPIGARVLKVLTDLIALEARGVSRAKSFAEMQTRHGLYDPHVLDSVSVCFDVFLNGRESVQAAAIEVSLVDLLVGHVLVDKIETSEGVVIVGAGTLVTAMLLEKLRNFAAVSGIKEPIRVTS